jgi:hypothetical protein
MGNLWVYYIFYYNNNIFIKNDGATMLEVEKGEVEVGLPLPPSDVRRWWWWSCHCHTWI